MNKTHKTLMIILISLIIIIAFIIASLFLFNKKFSSNKNEQENSNSSPGLSKEEIDFAKGIIPYFGQYQANIYQLGDFTLDTLPNELALLLAWNNLGYNDYEYDDYSNLEDEHFKPNNNGGAIISVSQNEMKESIATLFGTAFKYKDTNFKDEGIYPSFSYSNTIGNITYNNGIYTANWTESGGGNTDSIYEVIDSFEKIENGYKVYVKTAYVHSDENSIIYSDCDFENKKLLNEVTTFDEIPNNDVIDEYIKEHKDLFTAYSYTMLYDENLSHYYLSEFHTEK